MVTFVLGDVLFYSTYFGYCPIWLFSVISFPLAGFLVHFYHQFAHSELGRTCLSSRLFSLINSITIVTTKLGISSYEYIFYVKCSVILFVLFYFKFHVMLPLWIIIRTARCVSYFFGTWVCHHQNGKLSSGSNSVFSTLQFVMASFVVGPMVMNATKHADHHDAIYFPLSRTKHVKT